MTVILDRMQRERARGPDPFEQYDIAKGDFGASVKSAFFRKN